MNQGRTSQVTRRKFLTSASLGVGALWLAPPDLFAQNGNPVTVSGGTLTWLDPHDIEYIQALKDPSQTAIYGVRGANGVILIRTKGSH